MSTPTYRALGLNLNDAGDSSPDMTYANIVHHGRCWAAVGNPYVEGSNGITVDANGEPADDFSLVVTAGLAANYAHGLYTLTFTGRSLGTSNGQPDPSQPAGGVSFEGANGTIHSASYDAPSNTTTITYTLDLIIGDGGLRLVCTNTRRTANDTTNTGLTNLVMQRPVSPGSNTSHPPTERYSRAFLQMCSPFAYLRNLNWLFTNNLDVADDAVWSWSQRRLPTDPLQAGFSGAGNANRGMCIEDQIAICNAAGGRDLWFTIPDVADDGWITNLYLAAMYGTDGVNLYTGTGGSNPVPSGGPVYAALEGKLYVEWSNEITFNYGFDQWGRNIRLALESVQNGDPNHLNYDGLPATTDSQYTFGGRRIGYQAKRLGDLAKSVNAFGSKVFVVLMGLNGNTSAVQTPLDYLAYVAGSKAGVASLIHFAGCGWYNGMNTNVYDDSITVDQVIGTGIAANTSVNDHISMFSQYGNIPFAGYEGGLSHGNQAITPLCNAVLVDPRFGRLCRAWLDTCFAAGATLLGHFGSTLASWGLVFSPSDLTIPKYVDTVAGGQAWAANPSGATSTDPLPPLATITLVTITPPSSITPGSNATYIGNMIGQNAPIVSGTWSTTQSTITQGGVLAVPGSCNVAQTFAITYTSTLDTTKSATLNVTIPAATDAAPPVQDSSFELPVLDLTSNNSRVQNPTGLPWTFDGSAGYCGISSYHDDFASANPATPAGNQVLDLAQAGAVSQVIPNWSAGTYTLSLLGCQRNANNSALQVDILVDSTVIDTWLPPSTSFTAYTSPQFTVTSGSHTIGIRGKGGLDNNGLFDNVSLTAEAVTPPPPPPITVTATGIPRLLRQIRHLRNI